MRSPLLVILLAIQAASLGQPINYHVQGKIKDGYAYRIYLRYKIDTDTALGIDVEKTAETINGKFTFSGTIPNPVQSYLVLDGRSYYAPLYLDEGNINVTASVSQENGIDQNINKITLTAVAGSRSDSLQRVLRDASNEIFKTKHTDEEEIEGVYQLAAKFIAEHPDHNLSAELIKDLYQLSSAQLQTLINNLGPRQQARAARIGVNEVVARAKLLENRVELKPVKNTNGDMVLLSDLKYKYILLFFRDANCEYCDKKETQLHELYKKYAKRGLLIASIHEARRDDDNAAGTTSIPWPQFGDYWKSGLHELFSIPYDPFLILMDRDNKVISINPSRDALDHRLKQLFK